MTGEGVDLFRKLSPFHSKPQVPREHSSNKRGESRSYETYHSHTAHNFLTRLQTFVREEVSTLGASKLTSQHGATTAVNSNEWPLTFLRAEEADAKLPEEDEEGDEEEEEEGPDDEVNGQFGGGRRAELKVKSLFHFFSPTNFFLPLLFSAAVESGILASSAAASASSAGHAFAVGRRAFAGHGQAEGWQQDERHQQRDYGRKRGGRRRTGSLQGKAQAGRRVQTSEG